MAFANRLAGLKRREDLRENAGDVGMLTRITPAGAGIERHQPGSWQSERLRRIAQKNALTRETADALRSSRAMDFQQEEAARQADQFSANMGFRQAEAAKAEDRYQQGLKRQSEREGIADKRWEETQSFRKAQAEKQDKLFQSREAERLADKAAAKEKMAQQEAAAKAAMEEKKAYEQAAFVRSLYNEYTPETVEAVRTAGTDAIEALRRGEQPYAYGKNLMAAPFAAKDGVTDPLAQNILGITENKPIGLKRLDRSKPAETPKVDWTKNIDYLASVAQAMGMKPEEIYETNIDGKVASPKLKALGQELTLRGATFADVEKIINSAPKGGTTTGGNPAPTARDTGVEQRDFEAQQRYDAAKYKGDPGILDKQITENRIDEPAKAKEALSYMEKAVKDKDYSFIAREAAVNDLVLDKYEKSGTHDEARLVKDILANEWAIRNEYRTGATSWNDASRKMGYKEAYRTWLQERREKPNKEAEIMFQQELLKGAEKVYEGNRKTDLGDNFRNWILKLGKDWYDYNDESLGSRKESPRSKAKKK